VDLEKEKFEECISSGIIIIHSTEKKGLLCGFFLGRDLTYRIE